MKITVKRKIRRQALIIQNPGETKDFRAGVLKDVSNFSDYLISNIGGAWECEEITIAPIDADIDWIENYFKKTKNITDYYLILFTGHGDYDEQNGPRCYLMNGDWFNHAWLKQQVACVPTLFLTDSCQGIEKLNEGGTLGQRSFSSICDTTRRFLYRNKYDEILISLPIGMFVVGSSVSPGEYAEENPAEGGHYIVSLVKAAKDTNLNSLSKPGVYGITYLHMLATEKVKVLSKGKQTPYLEGYNRSFQPPFMVKL